jgi:hypothetical protein
MSNWFKNRGAEENFIKYILPELGGKKVRYLEIGSWAGNSIVWMFENVLTNSRSSAIVVDPWLAVRKHDQAKVDSVCRYTMKRLEPFKHRCTIYRQASSVWLRLNDYPSHTFDFIYIDGDHTDLCVMDDAVLSWPLLRVGGIMIFDDYNSRARDPHHVRHAVSAFMCLYGNGYAQELFTNYQYGIRKIKDVTMLAFNSRERHRKPGLAIMPEVF